MTTSKAFFSGIQRVNRTLKIIFLIYLVNLLIVMAFGSILAGAIEKDLGNSLDAQNLRKGFDYLWYDSFSSQAGGIAKTFTPTVTGIGAVFNGLDDFLNTRVFSSQPAILAMGFAFLLLWTFFSAGFIASFLQMPEKPSFFHESARFFWRFLLLGILAAICYYIVLHYFFQWISAIEAQITRQTVDERTVFIYTVIKYLIVWLPVVVINIIFDYSKVAIVRHDLTNALRAPLRAVRFIMAHWGKVIILYLAVGVVWIGWLALYWAVVPGAATSTWGAILWAFVIGQIYLIIRIWTKGFFYASETVLYDGLVE